MQTEDRAREWLEARKHLSEALNEAEEAGAYVGVREDILALALARIDALEAERRPTNEALLRGRMRALAIKWRVIADEKLTPWTEEQRALARSAATEIDQMLALPFPAPPSPAIRSKNRTDKT